MKIEHGPLAKPIEAAFLSAPRCGAKTRKGTSCKAPAMPNGRCRMHGGLSSGPKTAEGRKRCGEARLVHGGYTKEAKALKRLCRQVAASYKEIKEIIEGNQ